MDLETQKAGPPPQAIAAQDEAAKKEMAAAERGTIGAFSSFVKDLVTWSVPSLSSSSEKVPQEEPKTSDGLMSYAEAEASAEAAEIEHTEGPMPSSPVDKDYRLATRAETALEIGREAFGHLQLSHMGGSIINADTCITVNCLGVSENGVPSPTLVRK